ncbi:FAD-dependent oxidoreductase, partial [Staphylococcus epidermidis]|uniref:FAD-dependent oxidoreductase n=1 Tax=Staphylococcus epidermidis TaxID=1282 RepID=UPI001642D60F
IRADKILMNSGSGANMADMKGIDRAENIYDCRGLVNIEYEREEVVIIGGGYIGLEFASMFGNFGTDVRILEGGGAI